MIGKLFSAFNLFGFALLAVALMASAWVNKPAPPVKAPSYVLSERVPVAVKVHYLAADGSGLGAENRNIPVVQGSDNTLGVANAAIGLWAEGPHTAGLKPVLPKDAAKPQVWLRSDNFYVSLPMSYRKMGLSVVEEHYLVCSLARTLLDNGGLSVTFLLDNKNVAVLNHIDLRQPFVRQDCPDS